MAFKPVRTAIVGCGMIGTNGYLPRCLVYKSKLDMVGYFDQDPARAEKCASVAGGGKVYRSLDELLNDSTVEIVLNLTTGDAHYPVSLKALRAGKNVYSEKPIAGSVREATDLIETATEMKVMLACAPSATLGYEQQLYTKRIRNGEIGKPFSCVGSFPARVDAWHPNADVFLNAQPGAIGDAAPYPLTMMTTILGPVKRLYGWSPIAIPNRMIRVGPKAGKQFTVGVPDHGLVLLEFESEARGLLFASWSAYSETPRFEVHGPDGLLAVNPHDDGRGIKKHTVEPGADYVLEQPAPKSYTGLDWGKGVVDLADAIRTGRKPRCQAEQARHVVEIAEATAEATRTKMPVEMKTRFEPAELVGEVAPWDE